MSKKNIFTSHWKDNNISFEIEGSLLFNYFLSIFFKSWYTKKKVNVKHRVLVDFTVKKNLIKTPFYDYLREVNNNQIKTSINNVKLFRAIIRSIYKIFNRKASVVGLPELYMAIIRKTIIEPIEYINYNDGWKLIHASVFKFNDKVFIVSAGSKVGKSTLVSTLISNNECEILADNYCFVKDNMVRTVEEPMRAGLPSNFKLSFYARTINGYPTSFEEVIDHFIILKRDKVNKLSKIDHLDLKLFVDKTNKQTKEGVFFLEKEDAIKICHNEIFLNGNYSTFELEMAEGIKNIDLVIEILKNIE